MCVQLLSHVQLFVTLWTVARQAPLSKGVPRQEYWRGLPFPSSGESYQPKFESASFASPALQVESLPMSHQGKAINLLYSNIRPKKNILVNMKDQKEKTSSEEDLRKKVT